MWKNDFFELCFPTEAERSEWVSRRYGEFRVGQQTLFRSPDSDLWKKRKYHILGIAEDIGPRANGGFAGASNAFAAFIPRFLALQSNDFLSGEELVVHGVVSEIPEHEQKTPGELVEALDECIANWTHEVVTEGGVPIVIGGGHNNALGLIRGLNRATGEQISVVNMDPHADTRDLEGRHSGNPFSYAWGESLLMRYAVLGLHQSYNNESILRRLELMKSYTAFFEDWIDDPQAFYRDIKAVVELTTTDLTGIELDMDSIAFMPSSAFTPSGLTLEQARYYIRKMAHVQRVGYVHFPEAAPFSDEEKKIVGKSLSYLVSDFIKCHRVVS